MTDEERFDKISEIAAKILNAVDNYLIKDESDIAYMSDQLEQIILFCIEGRCEGMRRVEDDK